jgi:hypothetical protein
MLLGLFVVLESSVCAMQLGPPVAAPAPALAPAPAPANPAPVLPAPPPLVGPPPVLAPVPYASYPPAPPPGVFVEVRADDPRVRIDRVMLDGVPVPVCAAPCRQVLDRSSAYLLQGDGVVATSPFLLPDGSNQVVLDVHAGSRTKRMLGVALLVVGAGVTLVGFGGVSLGGTFRGERGRREERNGLIMMGIGIPVAIVGWVLFRSARTSVVSSSGATFSDRGPRPRAPLPRLALTADGLSF